MSATACLITARHTPAGRIAARADVDPRGLLGAVADGLDGAMDDLWAQYAGGVRGLARSLSGATTNDAEDVLQETMAKVWTSACTYDPARGSEATFVYTIARRVIIDRWRRSSRRVVEVGAEERPMADPRSAAPFDHLLVRDSVRDAVAGLSPAQREVVELAYFTGLTQAEIAERLGLPLGTVKTRTFAALRALREVLADAGLLR